MDMSFETHLYSVIVDVFIDDLRNTYKGTNGSLVKEFEDELNRYETLEEAGENAHLENLYIEIIEYCPDFNNPEYWGNLITALNTYDNSIRSSEKKNWEINY